jgi:alkylation response protein AidB-like acyl-CoA dehydrogenase
MDECLQLFGGYGYMMEYPIAELYVDARVQRIYGGTNEIMKELASRSCDGPSAGPPQAGPLPSGDGR